jgi:threonine dehydrogenase-like Zn-dependent dehydrogenase
MKALCWHGKHDVRYDTVPDPKIRDPRDAIVRVTATAICGSDLHLYNGIMPTMESGDVLGHEFMGEVMDVGAGISNLKRGDRVVVPFCMACGDCFFCKKGLTSCCDKSNPNAEMARKLMGHAPAGLFGYSHLTGGFAGGQAEYVRVPFADIGGFKIPTSLPDEKVLFLTDIFPTGYMAAENADIEKGDTVAIWGCGPVGQFAIKSAWMFGAGRVIAIDRVPDRLWMAQSKGKAETINFDKEDVYSSLMEMTKGRGPDRCIDSVGTEAHAGGSFRAAIDKAKTMLFLGTDRPEVLREAIFCCRKGGTVSVPGVYVGYLDKIPFGAFMNKGLTMKTGQTHVHRYLNKLVEKIDTGEIDPSYVITHRLKLKDGPNAYKTFCEKKDGCIKVVMTP